VAWSRGCPYDCTFCSIIEIYNRSTRFRSPEAVVEDIRQQMRLTGRRYVFFADDNFTAHARKCKDLLRRLIDAKLNLRFSAQVRLEFSKDEEFIRLMKEAGCYMVFIGFESINPQTLLDFQKRQTVDDIVYCVERLHRAGLHVHGMFVLGGDADDVRTVRETAHVAHHRSAERSPAAANGRGPASGGHARLHRRPARRRTRGPGTPRALHHGTLGPLRRPVMG